MTTKILLLVSEFKNWSVAGTIPFLYSVYPLFHIDEASSDSCTGDPPIDHAIFSDLDALSGCNSDLSDFQYNFYKIDIDVFNVEAPVFNLNLKYCDNMINCNVLQKYLFRALIVLVI